MVDFAHPQTLWILAALPLLFVWVVRGRAAQTKLGVARSAVAGSGRMGPWAGSPRSRVSSWRWHNRGGGGSEGQISRQDMTLFS